MRGQIGFVDFIHKYRKGIFLIILVVIIPVFVGPFVKLGASVVSPEYSGPIIMTLVAFFLFVGFDYLPVASVQEGDFKILQKKLSSLTRVNKTLEGKLARWIEVTGFKKPDAYRLPVPNTVEKIVEVEVEKIVEREVEKIVVHNQDELIKALNLEIENSKVEIQKLNAELGKVVKDASKQKDDTLVLQQELDSARSFNSNYLERINQLEAELVGSLEVSTKVSELQVLLQDSAREKDHAEFRLKQIAVENKELQALIQDRETQLKQQKTRYEKASQVVKKARNSNSLQRTRISELVSEISRLNSELQTLTAVAFEDHLRIIAETKKFRSQEREYEVYRQVVESQKKALEAELEEVASIATNEALEFQKERAELVKKLEESQGIIDLSMSEHDELVRQVENLSCDSPAVSQFFTLYREEREELARARLVLNETLPAISRAMGSKLSNQNYAFLNRFSKPDSYYRRSQALADAENQLLLNMQKSCKASHC